MRIVRQSPVPPKPYLQPLEGAGWRQGRVRISAYDPPGVVRHVKEGHSK